jgi:hypothetical protein
MVTIPTVTKIMIIRHGEKPPGTNNAAGVLLDGTQDAEALIVQGWQRAGALTALFAPSFGPLQNSDLATPQTIIASWTSATKGSQRPLETIGPLALKLGLEPQTFPEKSMVQAVQTALTAQGIVLICWQHEDIPAIASNISSLTNLDVHPTPPSPWPPPKWPGARYDLVWVFDLVTTTQPSTWTFTQVPQLLLSGDSSEVITSQSVGDM